ncbi:MAG: PDZ domain-containing protein [Pseudomonadota bacterium]|nr:PDZ domain-containing protein [Pseudomonadota bacterium]
MNKVLAIGFGFLLAGFTSAQASVHSFDKIIGVGLVIVKQSEKAFVIQEIVPNSPAATIGKIEIGDMITAVQTSPDTTWERVYGKSLEDVVAMIRGPLSTPVGLKIYHPADHAITEISLIRGEIEVPNEESGALH